MAQQEDVFKKIVSHCKEYGFVFPSSDIYDGLGAVYDYGQNGVELKNNIKQYWWQSMVLLHQNIVGIDAAIFMHPTTWKASGHVDAFNDPLIDNRDSKKRYRADVLIEDQMAKYDEKIEKEVAKAASASAMPSTRHSSAPPTAACWSCSQARCPARALPEGHERQRPRRAQADHPRRGKSYAPSAAPATGPTCASST